MPLEERLDQKALDDFHQKTIEYLNWIDQGETQLLSFKDHIDEFGIFTLFYKIKLIISFMLRGFDLLRFSNRDFKTSPLMEDIMSSKQSIDKELLYLPLVAIKASKSQANSKHKPMYAEKFKIFFDLFTNLQDPIKELGKTEWIATKKALDNYSKWMNRNQKTMFLI